MKVSDICKRGVIAVDNTVNVTAAAELMRQQHVGFLIVYRLGDEMRRPIGVLTDRDIVIEIVAKSVDPASVTVGDLMTRQPLVTNGHEELGDVLLAMRNAGIRRVPVVDTRGALMGVVACPEGTVKMLDEAVAAARAVLPSWAATYFAAMS
jgi:predicted transcriptional regulator